MWWVPDILPVCLQNFLYSRKSELRAQIRRTKQQLLLQKAVCLRHAVICTFRGKWKQQLFTLIFNIEIEREELHLVHQYKNNGYNIVLDVNSGAIHVVDDVSYDVIALYEDHTPEEIVAELSGTYKMCIRDSPWSDRGIIT